MARVSLSSYILRVKNKRNNQYVPLDNIISGDDFFDGAQTYLTNRNANPSRDITKRKLLKVKSFNSTTRTLRGIIETGDYGYESDLYDVNTGNISYRRQTEEAEMLPFYFLLYLPKRANEGIVLLQRFKQFGIRTIFLQDINQYFSLQYPNLEIEMNPLVPEQLINQYLDGRIIKLRFIRFNFPEDLADFIYNNQNHVEEEGSTEYVVSVKRGGNINLKERFHEVVDGRRNLKDLIEIQKIQNFDYDNVKIEVMIGKNRRTIDLSHLDRIRAYYDITNDIILGDNGHPDFDSINSIAEQLLKDLLNSITRGI